VRYKDEPIFTMKTATAPFSQVPMLSRTGGSHAVARKRVKKVNSREIYIHEKKASVARLHPSMRMEEIKQMIGNQWNTLTAKERHPYDVEASR